MFLRPLWQGLRGGGEFLIGRINSEMVNGVHGGVQLQESLLHILPLSAKLIVGKTRGQRMRANINGLKIGATRPYSRETVSKLARA